MHYLRAGAVLLATVLFCLTAFGQSPPSVRKIGSMGRNGAVRVANSPPPDQPIQSTVMLKRYHTPDPMKDWIASGIEYQCSNCVNDCMEIGPGSWSYTSPTPEPPNGIITQGVISGHLFNGDCPDETFQFATLYFEWTSRTNRTVTPLQGPFDRFTATWTPPDNVFSQTYNFTIQVPVVHPRGEFSNFVAWSYGSISVWQQALACCEGNGTADSPNNDDPDFSFEGDCVQEQVWSLPINRFFSSPAGLVNLKAACFSGANVDAAWIILGGSRYYDYVGFLGSPPNNPVCLNFSFQDMYFMSQAESGLSFAPYSAHNILQTGQVPSLLPNTEIFFAQRSTPLSSNGFVQIPFNISQGYGIPQIGAPLRAAAGTCAQKLP
jgi:hypothetical protein